MNSNSKEGAFLTVPEKITAPEKLLLTGNEYISLPHINLYGGITSLNVLRLDHKCLLEFCGDEEKTLLTPFLKINDQMIDINEGMKRHYHLDWLPTFSWSQADGLEWKGEIVAPPGFKGFYYRLILTNKTGKTLSVEMGWQGYWSSFNQIVFTRRPVEAVKNITYDRWTRSLILEASTGLSIAALAIGSTDNLMWEADEKNNSFEASRSFKIEDGEETELVLYGAVNLESDGAGTTSVDLRRRGWASLYEGTENFLKSRRVNLEDSSLEALLNRNLFFCYFYSLGRSLDGEELVAVTSRSPRYYVSAAFWSRDTLLWAFPAILLADLETARELILTVFKRHIRNAGDHAHYIDGTLLYPGFELDELAAYCLALERYLTTSSDESLLEEEAIQNGLNLLANKALEHFDPHCGLYSTFLDPSDDPVSYPYLTYDNALLQRAFRFLASLQERELWHHKGDFGILSRELLQAIYDHCMVNGPFGMMFAWAVGGGGRFILYDNPPGSLQLLAHYGFCSIEDTVFLNTVRWIRSSNNEYYHQEGRFEEAGSLHAVNPWPLGACNDLLACNVKATDFFKQVEMDNGFFCETIDPDTGEVSTGAAFASAAGFLAYALQQANTKKEGCNNSQETF